MRGTAWLPAMILVLGGCDNSPNQAPTLSASFSADSDGVTIHVFAAFLSDSACSGFSLAPCFVELGSSDVLTATAGGTTVTLTQEAEPPKSGIHYVGSLPQGPGFTDVVITYKAGGADAVSSRVTLAAPFTVASGIPESFHVGDVLEIVFSPERSPLPDTVTPSFVTGYAGLLSAERLEPAPGTGGIDLGFEGTCVSPGFPPNTDDLPNFWIDPPFDGKGTYHTEVLAAGGIGCDVTVYVRAETGGFVDPHFGASLGFAGLQEQTVKSHILPSAQGSSPNDGGSDGAGLPGDAASDSAVDAGVDAAADAGVDSAAG